MLAASQRQSKEKKEKNTKMPTSTLKVAMACGGCEAAVRRVLEATPGVQAVAIDLKAQRVDVTGDAALDALLDVVNKAGKKAEAWPGQ